MIRYVLDTDHISLYMRGNVSIQHRLQQIPPDQIAVTIITAEELLRGRLAQTHRANSGSQRIFAYQGLLNTIKLSQAIPILPFDETAELHFADLTTKRLRIGTQDLRIAAVVVAHDATLVTRNQRDFSRIQGLRSEDWSETR